MESLSIETKNSNGQTTDVKNESIDLAIASPSKVPIKTSGVINSNARYIIENYSKQKKVEMAITYVLQETEAFCVRFDPDDVLMAVATLDGVIKIYNTQTKKTVLNLITSPAYTPATILRWRPPQYSSQTKGVLLCANSEGSISQWHVPTGKQLVKLNEIENQIFALDYYEDGTMFASAGKDTKIRIYDEETKNIKGILQGVQWQSPGHNNRIFSVKFINSDDPNTLISGGWDNNLHFWDLRTNKTYSTIYGPSISGDSIDYKKGVIITGSHRSKEYLQAWDYKTKKKIQDINWEYGYQSEGSYIYSVQYQKKGNEYFVAGSTGINEAKIFDVNNNYKPIAKIADLKKGIYSVDCSNNGEKIAISGGEGIVFILNIKDI